MLKVDDIEDMPQINSTRLFPEHHLTKDAIELVAIDQRQLAIKEKEAAEREREKDRKLQA